MIFIPAIIMLIFGFVAGGAAKNLPVMVDNQDTGYTIPARQMATSLYFGDSVVSSLLSDDRLKVDLGSSKSGKTGVDNGTYYAAITLPANFSQVLFLRSTGQNLNSSVTVT
jgi:uncharacterized phage infection (PIP) family protein YhgE